MIYTTPSNMSANVVSIITGYPVSTIIRLNPLPSGLKEYTSNTNITLPDTQQIPTVGGELELRIGGVLTPFIQLEYSTNMGAVSSSISITTARELYDSKPFSMSHVVLSLKNTIIFQGTVEKMKIQGAIASSTISISGRSVGRLLEKSIIPDDVPKEYNNTTDASILTTLSAVYGITIKIENTITIKKFIIKENENTLTIMQRLLQLSNSQFSHNPATNIVEIKSLASIGKSNTIYAVGDPYGIGDVAVDYDTTELMGTLYNNKTTPSEGDDIEKSQVRNERKAFPKEPLCWGVSNNEEGVDPLTQLYRNILMRAYTISITLPSWENPSTQKMWYIGDVVQMGRQELFIASNTLFVVSGIVFRSNIKGKSVTLELSRVDLYTDDLGKLKKIIGEIS